MSKVSIYYFDFKKWYNEEYLEWRNFHWSNGYTEPIETVFKRYDALLEKKDWKTITDNLGDRG